MIWQYVHGVGAYQNIENWKCGFTLRGHSGDVLDLSWSAKDNFLASCSVDNTVIIWNALKFPEIIKRINAHAGLVKGVAWDPVGTFFASQSDDKTLKIWKSLDWSLEKIIDGPFKQCTGSTHVLRLNWSPDGQLVISAHAINNGVPTAQVIDRANKWSTKLDFVGHRKAVTTVRFFPQILKPVSDEDAVISSSNNTTLKTHCLCALGSRDRSISIWLTNYSRPLFVLHDSFDNPIMDLTWSKSPLPGLLACSMDGTVSYIEFDLKEVGRPLTREETSEFFIKKYNHDINNSNNNSEQTNSILRNNNSSQNGAELAAADAASHQQKNGNGAYKLIENIDILLAQEQKERQHQQFAQNENANLSTHPPPPPTMTPPSKQQMLTENHKQIERRMPDGRRRITPICVCKPGDFDTPMPFGSLNTYNKLGFAQTVGFSNSSNNNSSMDGMNVAAAAACGGGSGFVSKTATELSTIIIEKRDERDQVVDVSPIKSIIYQVKHTSIISNEEAKSAETTTEMEMSTTTTTNKIEISQKQIQKQIDTQPLSLNKTNKTISLSSSCGNNNNNKTVHTKQQPHSQKSNVIKTNNVNVNIPVGSHKSPLTKLHTPPTKHTSLLSSFSDQHHQIDKQSCFNYLKPIDVILEKDLTKIIKRESPSELIKIHNSIPLLTTTTTTTSDKPRTSSNTEHQINSIKYLKNNSLKWQVYVYARICDLTCNTSVISCVCEDSTIHFFKSLNGSQLCLPIVLDSRAVSLKSKSNFCLCLTSSGHVYVWKFTSNQDLTLLKGNHLVTNFENITAEIQRESCQFILNKKDGGDGDHFLECDLTETGVPIINMSKNRSYFFSVKTKSWHLVPCLGVFSSVAAAVTTLLRPNDGPLNQIQSRHKNSSVLKTIETLNNKAAAAAAVSFDKKDLTLTHLESQVNASIGLNSAREYKFWLMTLARYLVENNYEEKLTEMCNSLLGPLYSLNWSQTLLTFNKRDLLKEILLIVAENLNLQRVYSFYNGQLNLINNLSSKNSVLDRLVASSSSSSSLRSQDPNKKKKTTTNVGHNNDESSAETMNHEDIFKMPDIPVQTTTIATTETIINNEVS
jgi:protein HIRA/HIR1